MTASWWDLTLTLGAIATALTALGALAVKVGRPTRPGVMARLAELEHRTAELRPNGGSSLADAVHRIETRVARIERQRTEG